MGGTNDMNIEIIDLPALTSNAPIEPVITPTEEGGKLYDYAVAFATKAAAVAWAQANAGKFSVRGNRALAGRVLASQPIRIIVGIRSQEPLTFPAGTEAVNPRVIESFFGVFA
jgi:hypothetical protein